MQGVVVADKYTDGGFQLRRQVWEKYRLWWWQHQFWDNQILALLRPSMLQLSA